MNPHILFIAPSAYTLSGLATWLDYLLPGLKQLGWRTTLGLVEGTRYHRVADYLAVHPCESAIAITCKTGTPQGRRWAVQRAIQEYSPDIVVTVNIPDAIAATAELRSRGETQAKIVMTCHGIQEDLFADMKLFKNSLDAVVCTNKLACKLAEDYSSLDKSSVFYAPCGAPTRPLTPRKSEKTFKIIFVGRLEQQQKRVHDLPAILENLSSQQIPFHLKIVGTGPEEIRLRDRLSQFINSGEVSFLGHVPSHELWEKAYFQADALLMPSCWETGPIVIWEAMAMGVPVVSSRYIGSGLENALKNRENCLLFNVGDTETATQQLITLYSDPECWQNIRQNAWDLARLRYSEEASIKQWNEVFQSVISMPLKAVSVVNSKNATGDQSRLDRWLGNSTGEYIRQFLGKTCPNTGAGGEWPHSWQAYEEHQEVFFELSKLEDFNL
ncbi:glycosyltransferase family 4 protein [Sphaerospermopsis sp. FACHB-1094]|uniref:glycosyltransferase family 4 protein n=1 Tax=Sphaerospermopsis sp. FACHB-1094 TaxID=2692861 RepID=UPI001688696C|nr:glycosyltransferase family 4 protein [Sphaerospermopsis sp. FACHB-1094]MBD2134011.1 glycosyltransferase family 4 protein [Sphaerospermopsis sp. FACHB-1094]